MKLGWLLSYSQLKEKKKDEKRIYIIIIKQTNKQTKMGHK